MQKIFFKNKNSKTSQGLPAQTGFTLIETLVALAIFASSIVALISITGTGVADANFAKNKLTASYLSQEGVELVRNIRDSVLLSGSPTGWSDFIANQIDECMAGNSPKACRIDPKTLAVNACPQAACPPLLYDNNSGFFGYDSGNNSIFTRTITIDDLGSGNEIKINSTVSWHQGGVQKSVSYSENLLDWIR